MGVVYARHGKEENCFQRYWCDSRHGRPRRSSNDNIKMAGFALDIDLLQVTDYWQYRVNTASDLRVP
jgi:hypothetical protein